MFLVWRQTSDKCSRNFHFVQWAKIGSIPIGMPLNGCTEVRARGQYDALTCPNREPGSRSRRAPGSVFEREHRPALARHASKGKCVL